jgi:hypothetical protein
MFLVTVMLRGALAPTHMQFTDQMRAKRAETLAKGDAQQIPTEAIEPGRIYAAPTRVTLSDDFSRSLTFHVHDVLYVLSHDMAKALDGDGRVNLLATRSQQELQAQCMADPAIRAAQHAMQKAQNGGLAIPGGVPPALRQ